MAEKSPKPMSGKERFFRDNFAGMTLAEAAQVLGLGKKTLLSYMQETANAIYLQDGKIAYSSCKEQILFPGTPEKPKKPI